ncbi:MAG: adenylate/guanylate cyclase domain-containing protein [Desulfatiglandales bacterium]
MDTDSPKERRRKVTLVVITVLCTIASIIWGTLYYAIFGPTTTPFITFGFTVVLGIALIIYFTTKQFNFLLYVFFFMILWNPIAMQWSLGGFAASGVLMLWSLLAPFSSLMFQNIKKSTVWFLAYLVLLFFSLYFDNYVSQWASPVSNKISMLFFGMNIIGPSIIIFCSMMYFINAFQREHVRSEKLLLNLMEEREKLADMADLLKKMFGRYLSTEVMNSLIENPSALELGGERRSVTIMMTDLRGFTALSERLTPEQVVQMLNSYFEVMVEVILKFNGTINEIIGDALLVIFGAPQEMPDRTQKAIACAIDMQNAMAKVNEENRAQGLPELEMGIGLNETEAIVGNIGSSKRSKYAVVGSGVNMTSRIESYTVGGQILISESVRQEAGEILRIDAQRDVLPKGSETPLRIYEVGGIAGQYNLALEGKAPVMVTLARQIPLRYMVLEGKNIGKKGFEGSVVRLSEKNAVIALDEPLEPLTNLKMNLADVDVKLSARDFYGKVIERAGENRQSHVVRFTSVPPEIDAYFQSHRHHAAKPTVS